MLTHTKVTEAMHTAMQGERLPPPALAELQERKWRDLSRFAVARAPFYRRLYHGIDLARAALTDLPPINKEQVQAHFDEVVTDPRLKLAGVRRFCQESTPTSDPWYLDAFAVLQSSGTSGLRGSYVWDAAALADAVAVGYRQSNRGGATGPQRLAAIMQIELSDATNILLSLVPESLGSKRLIDIRQDLSAILDQLNEFQPTVLASYPYLLWLLCEAARAGRLHIRPRRITSSADVLTASDRGMLHAVFGVEPYNYYCSTEVPYLAWECDAHDGLHVNADYVLLESVSVNGQPVPPGQLGDKVFITNLSNRALPLLRYEMSDQVEWMSAPCTCGCLLPRIRTVAGRVEHILTLPGTGETRVRLVEEYVDDMIGRLESVARYQVVQEEPARLTVNVIARAPAEWEQVRRAVVEGFERCFRKYGVDPARVRLEVRSVEQLEPVQAGSRKVCRFWNRCHD